MADSTMYRERAPRAEVAESFIWERRQWRPVSWSALLVGIFAAFGTAAILALFGAAIGAHQLAPNEPANWKALGAGAIIFGALSAFISYFVGGWIAGRIVGGSRQVTAAHGLLTWLISIPAVALFMAVGAGTLLGGLSSALEAAAIGATQLDQRQIRQAERERQMDKAVESARQALSGATGIAQVENRPEETAGALARNSALAALLFALLGLAGGLVGGGAAGNRMPMFLPSVRSAL